MLCKLLTLILCSLLTYLFGWQVIVYLSGYEPHPDAALTTCEIVRVRGLKCDEYQVPTSAGYVLTLHRIRPLLGVPLFRKPVLIQHGLTGTSLNFVISSEHFSADPRSGVGHNLGLELARHGYDVWLSNNRGSHFSMRHLKFNSSDSRFWNFTFDDIAREDMPSVMDYVLGVTGSRKLSYIGHSQGTVVMFALLSNSSYYRYNDIIEPFIALSPVAVLKNSTSAFRYVVSAMKTFGGNDLDVPVFMRPRPYQKAKKFLCNTRAKVFCKLLFMSICGFSDQTNNVSDKLVSTIDYQSNPIFSVPKVSSRCVPERALAVIDITSQPSSLQPAFQQRPLRSVRLRARRQHDQVLPADTPSVRTGED